MEEEDVDDDDPKAPSVESPQETGPSNRRSPAFLKELVSRLPQLAVAQWESAQTLNVYQDMQGIVGLDADAFLRPLEPIAESRHE